MIETILITLLIGYILNFVGIKFLKNLNLGQNIREEGPRSHLQKAGTPTMGGIFIIATIIGSSLITKHIYETKYIVGLIALVGFGLVGFIDDYLKSKKGKNLGLRSWQKMLGIILVSLFVIGYILGSGEILATNKFLLMLKVDIPIVFALFGIFLLAGTSNAVNLTDGLDGLAAGTGAIAFIAFSFLAVETEPAVSALCVIIATSLLAFLWFNGKPAQVFMGDVGSLAIGGALGTIALLIHKEINLVVIGGLFVAEALSVIIQVASFKLTGKRVFRMSPIHHHFELLGWPEIKVVIRFWIIAAIFALLGLLF